MPETRVWEVETTVSMSCPTGDGGTLVYAEGEIKDDPKNGASYMHRCTNVDDLQIYKLEKRYPYREWQLVNLDIIPGLKIQ